MAVSLARTTSPACWSTRSKVSADLEAGRIRVLHDRSFLDDPTRILRAIRYEDRYGFRMDETPRRSRDDASPQGHVGDLSGARLREELIALSRRATSSHAIPRLAELGAENEIHHARRRRMPKPFDCSTGASAS